MAEAAWTAIGLLAATLFGSIFWLGSRLDGLASRIDSLSANVDARFAHVDARFDALNARFDSHLDTHQSRTGRR